LFVCVRAVGSAADLRSELSRQGGLGQLTEAERQRIAEGLSFKAAFEGAADVQPLPWRLPDSTCEIAYAPGDPNPWCRCTTVVPAAPEDVFEFLWQIDSEHLRYHEHVRASVLERPSLQSVKWIFRVRVVPGVKPFEFHLSGTWACLQSAGKKEYCIALLPTSGADATATRQLTLLSTGSKAHTTNLELLFQINFGARIGALERALPKFRVLVLRWHRELVA